MAHINKRTYLALQNLKSNEYRSQKSDSRVFCRQAHMRQKYFYVTEKKAQLAIRFSNGEITRAYECGTCMGWHTTSKSEEDYKNQKQSHKKVIV